MTVHEQSRLKLLLTRVATNLQRRRILCSVVMKLFWCVYTYCGTCVHGDQQACAVKRAVDMKCDQGGLRLDVSHGMCIRLRPN